MTDREKDLQGVARGWGQRILSTGKIAVSAARLATRRLFGSEGPQDGQIGEALAGELDKMKGMAMKVGQILSYFDGVLPEDTHQALRRLQQGVRPVAFAKMMAVIEQGLGQPLSVLFEQFEEQPIASASIGQVYRAQYQGKPVAVKVQYPQIAETIQSDFSILQKLSKVASLATAVDGPAIVQELQDSFVLECDYEAEARNQQSFASLFANVPVIQIPKVYPERSCQTVLTMEWCEGEGFYTFLEHASQTRKNEVGLLLVKFAYESLYGWGMIQADPHPGNYLFPQNDRVVFLDFGCVRHFGEDFLNAERRLARVVVENRRHDFQDALMATQMVAKPHKFDFDFHWELLRHQYAPYIAPHFAFTQDYLRQGMEFSRPSNPNLRILRIPPPWVWLQRLQWGLHAVLVRLGAEGNFRDTFHRALLKHGN